MSRAETGGAEWEEVCVGTRCTDGKYKGKETRQDASGRRQTMPRVTTTAIYRKFPTYLLYLRRYGGEKLIFADAVLVLACTSVVYLGLSSLLHPSHLNEALKMWSTRQRMGWGEKKSIPHSDP